MSFPRLIKKIIAPLAFSAPLRRLDTWRTRGRVGKAVLGSGGAVRMNLLPEWQIVL